MEIPSSETHIQRALALETDYSVQTTAERQPCHAVLNPIWCREQGLTDVNEVYHGFNKRQRCCDFHMQTSFNLWQPESK